MNDPNFVRSLLYSSDPLDHDAILIGQLVDGSPLMISWPLLNLPILINGAAGSGKTVCEHRIARQLLIRQNPLVREHRRKRGLPWNPVSVIYINFVRGPDFREAVFLQECARLGEVPFSRFCAKKDELTHGYSTFAQKFTKEIGRADLAAHIAQQADFVQGEAFGPKYFGGKDLSALIAAFKAAKTPFRSYHDMLRFFSKDQSWDDMGFSDRDREHASQVVDHVRIMSTVHPFNETRVPSIDLLDVFQRPQLVYFDLSDLDEKRAHTIAKAVFADTLKTADVFPDRRRCRVFFIADEAQSLVSSTNVAAELNRTRHRGVSVILANQYPEQMVQQRGQDLSRSVLTNAGVVIQFGNQSPDAMDEIQRRCPDDLRLALSYPVLPDIFSQRGDVLEPGGPITAHERWEPRYTKNDIINLNRFSNVAWIRIRSDSPPTRINGIEPFFWDHMMSLDEWNAYGKREVIMPKENTFVVEADPKYSEPTVAPKLVAPTPADRELEKRKEDMRDERA